MSTYLCRRHNSSATQLNIRGGVEEELFPGLYVGLKRWASLGQPSQARKVINNPKFECLWEVQTQTSVRAGCINLKLVRLLDNEQSKIYR